MRDGDSALDLAPVRFALAQAIVDEDPTRARRLSEEALAGFVEGHADEQAEQVRAFQARALTDGGRAPTR